MLRLKLLGGLVVEREDGSLVDGLPRRALGVLAVLACAGGKPVSRDKLVGRFWEDSDDERARHRLSDALSILRSALPDGTIVTSGDDVRLNPDRATTDVARLEGALEWGRPDQAVAAWSGPFLDGFFVSGAPGFEHWVDGERARLDALYARALTTLADEAEARDAPGEAVEWLRRLAGHLPFDSPVSARLIRALEAAGDPAGAIGHARVHAALLRGELGVEPPADLLSVLDEHAAVAPADPEEAGADPDVGASAAPTSTSGRSRRARWAAPAAAALVLLGLAGWWLADAGAGDVAPGAEVIAVLPFTTTGDGGDVLGEGMVDVLSSNLHEVGAIRTVNPRTVLRQWRRAGGGRDLGLDAALAVGGDVGAGSVLLGSLVTAGEQTRIDGQLYALDGDLLARARVDGPTDAILSLADELSIALLRDIWRSSRPIPTARLNAITTRSFDALRSYLRGERYFRAARWDSAATAYEAAVRHDSTFALAFARLSEVGGWRRSAVGTAQIVAWADAALRHTDLLPARERTLVRARRLFHDGDVSVVDSTRAYSERYPDDAIGRYYSADMAYHANPIIGFDLEAFFAAFDRAILADSTFSPAYHHPLELALVVGDRDRFSRYLAGLSRASPNDPRLPSFRESQRFRWSPPEVAVREFLADVRAGERALVASMHRALAAATLAAPEPRPDALLAYYDSAAAELASEAGVPDLTASRIRSLAGLGRLREATRALEGRPAEDWLGHGAGPVMLGYATPRFTRRVLGAVGAEDPSAAALLRTFAALHEGDAAAARRLVAAARRSDSGLPVEIFRALGGWVDVLAGDTLGGAEAMRSGLHDLGFADERARFTQPIRNQLALIDATRRATMSMGIDAVGLLRISPTNLGHYPYGQYVTARVLERAGRPAEAATAYRHFAALFDGADSELQPLVAEARAAADRLEGARQ